MIDTAQASGNKVTVTLGARSYDIVIESGALARAGELIRKIKPTGKAFVVTDANVDALYGKALLQSLERAQIQAKVFSVAPGEGSKNFATLEKLADDLVGSGIERGDLVIAFGGGVVGDLAGFASAVILRGIEFVQIPTTLMAQADSSVGGKTGINLPSGKNLVGSFHQPRLVIADPALLDTLELRQARAGYAEIVKMALIKDADLFAWLDANISSVFKNTPQRTQAIIKACRMKADIVARDEYESSGRMLLNLGHSFGHALEALTNYGDALLHGEAVSIGIVLAFRFSVALCLCSPEDAKQAEDHLVKAGLPASAKTLKGITAEKLLTSMLKDKKVTGGKIALILAHGIGKAFVSRDIEAEKLAGFLQKEMRTGTQ
jgi:3-dehydroquinate synthase